MLATTVPREVMPVTATLYVAPLPVTAPLFEPPDVDPVNVTSPVANPVTERLKTTVKLIGLVLVGSFWPTAWLIVTVSCGTTTPFGRVKVLLAWLLHPSSEYAMK